jgi:hypothetical protein
VRVRVAKAQSTSAQDVMARVWLLSCKCLDQVCTVKDQAPVMTVMAKVKSLMRKINARTAMVLRLSKRRKSLKFKLIRDLQMVRSISSTEKLMSFQVLNQVM